MPTAPNADIVLEFSFDMQNVDCISMMVIKNKLWKDIKKFLNENKEKDVVHAYANPSPVEIYGPEFTGEDLLTRIRVHENSEYVKAFKVVHGTEHYTGCHLLERLVDEYKEDLKKPKEDKKKPAKNESTSKGKNKSKDKQKSESEDDEEKEDFIILITGQREESDRFRGLIRNLLQEYKPTKVIFGECTGVDSVARKVCKDMEIEYEVFEADWSRGKRGGYIRNKKMIDTEPNLVLAFHRDIMYSKGTKMCVKLAKEADIPVQIYNYDDVALNDDEVAEDGEVSEDAEDNNKVEEDAEEAEDNKVEN